MGLWAEARSPSHLTWEHEELWSSCSELMSQQATPQRPPTFPGTWDPHPMSGTSCPQVCMSPHPTSGTSTPGGVVAPSLRVELGGHSILAQTVTLSWPVSADGPLRRPVGPWVAFPHPQRVTVPGMLGFLCVAIPHTKTGGQVHFPYFTVSCAVLQGVTWHKCLSGLFPENTS